MRKIKVGIVGLGRLGKEYARNLSFRVPNADLLAVCSINQKELDWAADEIGIRHLYTDYSDLLAHSGLEAVFVISSTNMHAQHLTEALQAGLHVFSEKPLATTTKDCLRVEKISLNYPKQKAVVGFVRRFDQSYQYAKEKIKQGAIGTPFLVRSQTVDKDTIAEFQLDYVGNSGGIFHDFNVHDVDLARWYLESEITSVWSIGGAYKHPGFGDAGDADNVMSTCQFDNGAMAVINASRTATHGHDTYTEIVGTEGTLRVGRPGSINRVEIYDKHGARRECVETFWDRFSSAFLRMTDDFINCLLSDRTPEITLRDATEATRATEAFSNSFKKKELIKLSR